MTSPVVKELPLVPRFDAADQIRVTLEKLRKCVGVFREVKTSSGTTIRFLHLLQGRQTGPRVRRFLQILDNHIVAYAMHNMPQYDQGNSEFDIDEYQDAMRKAREKFRAGDRTGQLGEFIVFCLVEALLQAPQAIPKMYHKQENQMEVPGVDGIHAKWDAVKGLLTLIWAEAKIEKDVVDGVRHAFESLRACRTEGRDAEDWDLLTDHPSQLYEGLEEHLKLWRKEGPQAGFDVQHAYAAFIGYEDDAYAASYQKHANKPEDLAAAFLEQYERRHKALVESCNKHSEKVPEPWSAIDVFFLPFPDVDDLRKKFERTLRGEPVSED